MTDPWITFRNAGEGPPATAVNRQNLNAMQIAAREEIEAIADDVAGAGINPYEHMATGQVAVADGAGGFAPGAVATPDDLEDAVAPKVSHDELDAALSSVVSGDAAFLVRNPDLLLVGAITRDANGAATAFAVKWPDGAAGAYAATTVSTAFPGAVDAYTVTHVVGSTTKTYTQPAVTRDPSTGAATAVPAITVA
jgi:hypothetical protein